MGKKSVHRFTLVSPKLFSLVPPRAWAACLRYNIVQFSIVHTLSPSLRLAKMGDW